MDWFLYDGDLRHEKLILSCMLKNGRNSLKVFLAIFQRYAWLLRRKTSTFKF